MCAIPFLPAVPSSLIPAAMSSMETEEDSHVVSAAQVGQQQRWQMRHRVARKKGATHCVSVGHLRRATHECFAARCCTVQVSEHALDSMQAEEVDPEETKDLQLVEYAALKAEAAAEGKDQYMRVPVPPHRSDKGGRARQRKLARGTEALAGVL